MSLGLVVLEEKSFMRDAYPHAALTLKRVKNLRKIALSCSIFKISDILQNSPLGKFDIFQRH